MARTDFKPDMNTTDEQWAGYWRNEADQLQKEGWRLSTDRNRLREFVEGLLDAEPDAKWAEQAREVLAASHAVDYENADAFFGLTKPAESKSAPDIPTEGAAEAGAADEL